MTNAVENVKPPLDDVMLSMDVVDTLRQDERIVERELNDEKRRIQLIERLRGIYRGQGIEVPDHILQEGVKALEERRFVYEPPHNTFEVRLAKLYVTRRAWGRWVGGGLAALALIWMGWQAFYVLPEARKQVRIHIELTNTLPDELQKLYSAVETETNSASVLQQASKLRNSGLAAAKAGQQEAAQQARTDLEAMIGELRLAYDITIVSRPGELSGLWRIRALIPIAAIIILWSRPLTNPAIGSSGKSPTKKPANVRPLQNGRYV